MGDGTFDEFIQSACPNALLRNRLEGHPAAFEMALRVEGQCRTVMVARQNTCFYQRLKAVADAYDRLARLNEGRNFVDEIGFQIKGKKFTRAQGIRVGEASGDDQ